MQIGNYKIDKESKVFIIAELSANHNGSLETAIETIHAAKRAGADCIKLQTYTADTITIDCDKEDFIIKDTIWHGRKLYDLYKEAYTPWEWHRELFELSKLPFRKSKDDATIYSWQQSIFDDQLDDTNGCDESCEVY
jgi:pseudaminic acid synthase